MSTKLKFPTNTIVAQKSDKVVTMQKTAKGWPNGQTDQEVYDANKATCFFVSPKNLKGIARLAKKLEATFPDFVATITSLEIAEEVKVASEKVNKIVAAPVQVMLNTVTAKDGTVLLPGQRLTKKGTIDKRYPATA